MDEVEATFRRFDADASGSIDVDELHAALGELGLGASMDQTRQVMGRYDADRSGTLELGEFRRLVDELRQFQRK